jgi:hypothetical protein
MNARTLTLLALAGLAVAIGEAGAANSNTGRYSNPTYTPTQSSPAYTPKLERPEPPKTYTPKLERPQAPQTYTPSGPTFTNRR